MSDQQNIDNFFRNRFKDFEASPDPEIWDKISEKLDAKEAEKEEKGIVYLPWLYRVAGIAAAIALLLFLGSQFFTTTDTVIDPDGQVTNTTNSKDAQDKNANSTTNNSQVTDTKNNLEEQKADSENGTTPDRVLQNNHIANEETVTGNKRQLQDKNGAIQQGNALQHGVVQQNGSKATQQSYDSKTIQSSNENAIATTTNKNNTLLNRTDNKQFSGERTDKINHQKHTSSVAENTKVDTNTTSHKNLNTTQGTETPNVVVDKNSTAVAQNNTQQTGDTSGLEKKENTVTTETITNTETAVTEAKEDTTIKKSILDVINDLHDLEKENKEVVEAPRKKWTLSPNASPVYYNTFGNGSPIHENFADNSKTGDLNLSYGLNVGYDVSKRLTVRSGIHRVNYIYSTNDIALVPSIDGTDITTIRFRANTNSFHLQDRQAEPSEVFSQYQLASTAESSIVQKQIEGNLNQRMSFVEIPVELKYAVVDKKLGINVIGGMSTLLLTENSVVLDSPELLTELGEANNINNVSFSTNIGIGIDYQFSKEIEFNLEPMLKYQLNTFSGNTGNFRPYSVGVYTGVSFRF
jgi:hypothetical protein